MQILNIATENAYLLYDKMQFFVFWKWASQYTEKKHQTANRGLLYLVILLGNFSEAVEIPSATQSYVRQI